MQIMPKIYKCIDMQVLYFFSTQNSENFDISQAFLPLTIAKLLTPKNSPVFWPTLYIVICDDVSPGVKMVKVI